MKLSNKLQLIAKAHCFETVQLNDSSIILIIRYTDGSLAEEITVNSVKKLYNAMGY